MKYTEIQIETTHENVDLVSDAMFSCGAGGVNIVDHQDVLDVLKDKSNWDYVDESLLVSSDTAILSTVVDFEDNQFCERLEDELSFFNISNYKISIRIIDDSDWENEWKKYFKPIKTKNITVVPSWFEYKKSENEKIIRLDPGMAFGTGEHATTRMCLEMLNPKNKTVLDVGCGSGILGISAKLLGAKSVYMCDFDEQAVKFAKENALSNNVDCQIECDDLLSNSSLKADLILANITADILIRLSKSIKEHLNEGGEIVLSGIIDTREQEVKNAYESIGLKLVEKREETDWRAYRFQWN